MSDHQIAALGGVGIASKADFATVGDAKTLSQITGLDEATAMTVMSWATGAVPSHVGGGQPVIVESADVVYCVHCKTRQPKDYKPGDLCVSCGKQAEPVLACYWCGASGPGKYCRQCGAAHVLSGELELALQLRRDGVAKDDVPTRLAAMSVSEKEALFARARKALHGHARNL